MISKFNGTCRYCKKPTKAGVDHYDLDAKTGYHEACKEEAESRPSPEQFELAERLGFIQYDQDAPADGLLRRMLPRDGHQRPDEGSPSREPHPALFS